VKILCSISTKRTLNRTAYWGEETERKKEGSFVSFHKGSMMEMQWG